MRARLLSECVVLCALTVAVVAARHPFTFLLALAGLLASFWRFTHGSDHNGGAR